MSNGWTTDPPEVPGLYEVRPRPLREVMEMEVATTGESTRPRVVRIHDVGGRFDAGAFGGKVRPDLGGGAPWWEWRGPIEVPDWAPQ